jgi:hypothetical protein
VDLKGGSAVKRLTVILVTTFSMALAVVGAAAPAGASVPNSGCPTGFDLVSTSILGENFSGQLIDLNNDELMCIRFLPSPPFPEGSFVFIDNTTP